MRARSLVASIADIGAGIAPAAQFSGFGISAHDFGIGLTIIQLIERDSKTIFDSPRLCGI